MKKGHHVVTSYIYKIIKKEYVTDNKDRKIFFSNTIFVIDGLEKNTAHLGFESLKNSTKNDVFDIEIRNINLKEEINVK